MPRGEHFKKAPVQDFNNITDMSQLPSDNSGVVDTPSVAVAPDEGIAKVFGNAPQQPTQNTNETMTVDAKAFQNMAQKLNDLERLMAKIDGSPVDLHDLEKRQKTVRVGQYTDEEGHEYLLVGLEEKQFRDGSRANSWNEGTEKNQSGRDVPITWIQPRLIDLATGVQSSPKVRYVEFSNILRTIPMKVKHEETVPVNMTTIEEVVDKVVYVDSKNGGLRGQGTGQQVKTSVWGVRSTFHVEYEGKQYAVEDTVVNYK